MAKIVHEISVFFPAYNEEAEIENTVKKAQKVLVSIADKWEIIIVDDGSSDKTPEISNKLAKSDRRIHVVTHKKNRGYGAGLKSGLYASRYAWIAYTDSDGQFDFSEIKKFIKKQKESDADLVIGYYIDRKVPFGRKVNTFVWETLVNLLFNLGVRDIDTGFKLLSKEVVEKIPKLESERGAFVESELLVKAKRAGFRMVQVGVRHYPRETGSGTGADLNVIVKSFLDLLRLWRKLR